MHSRLLAAIAVVVATVSLGLAGCSAADHNAATQDGIPGVSGDVGKAPSIDKGKGKAPDTLRTRVLHHGKGVKVTKDTTVAVDYKGQTWQGKVFDQTFKYGGSPTVFSLNQVVDGWQQGLTGKHVGDRVELVIPPDLGYGSQEQTNPQTGEVTIPANSTLVFVVDILGAMDPSDTSALSPDNATIREENELPSWLKVSGKLGQKPTIDIMGTPPQIAEDQIIILAEGKGKAIGANDYAAAHVTSVSLNGSDAQSTWDSGQMQVTAGEVGNTKQFLGMKIGTRAVWIRPQVEQSDLHTTVPATVYVIDYGAAMDVSRH